MIRPEPSAVDCGEFGSGSLTVHRFRGRHDHGLHPSPLVACVSPAGRGRTQSAASADPAGPPTSLVVDEDQGRTGCFSSRRHCVTTLRAALASRGTAAPSPAALRLAPPDGAGQAAPARHGKPDKLYMVYLHMETQHRGVSEISGPCPHLGPETPFLAAKMLDAYS
jgi:hypothetical protein